jgi:Uri superfamily endonuclease
LRADSVISIPNEPGTYILILESLSKRRVPVGVLGTLDLEPGFYAYVGSALGSGGLRGRLAHHHGHCRSPRWHIDYVRRHTALREIWFLSSKLRREHRWATVLAHSAGVIIPFAGFGASDCGCRAHLFRFSNRPRLSTFRPQLGALVPQSAAVSSAKIARWVSTYPGNFRRAHAVPIWGVVESRDPRRWQPLCQVGARR